MPNYETRYRQWRSQRIRWGIRYCIWRRKNPETRGPEPIRPVEPEPQYNNGLIRMKISHDAPPNRYSLELAWNDIAFVNNGDVGFLITATRQRINEDGAETAESPDSVEVSLSIIPDNPDNLEDSHPILRIEIPENDPIEIDLQELRDESTVFDAIPSSLFSPFNDPILGCFIRSGMSVSLRHVIKCTKETAGLVDNWFPERMRLIGNCLLGNVPKMSGKLAERTAVCIALGGQL